MKVTLELTEEQMSAWKNAAEAQGMSVEAWLVSVAEEQMRLCSKSRKDLPIWEVVAQQFGENDLPVDGAAEHDHYLYGHPKRFS